jgi:TPR repeat protein
VRLYDAQNNLGAMYANGKGTSKDAKQAVYLPFYTNIRLA